MRDVQRGVLFLLASLCLVVAPARAQQKALLIRVGLAMESEACHLSCAEGLDLADEHGNLIDHLGASLRIEPGSSDGFVVSGKTQTGNAIIVRPATPGAPLSLGGHAYRGQMVVLRSTIGRLNVINYVDVESYISGVLAGEMPNSWPEEALKAQAVAARSYVLHQVQQHGGRDWDVVATDRDQVYEGVAGEVPAIQRAVTATRGEVLTYDGKVIKAYFCSACGGHTEDAAVVFGEAAPYLAGVPDPYCEHSPYQQWTMEVSTDYLRRVLSQSGHALGAVLEVKAGRRAPSGHLLDITVVHVNGTETVSAVDLRRLMGYRDLRSTAFEIRVKKSVPLQVASTTDEWRTVTHRQNVTVAEAIEMGMEQLEPVNAVATPEAGFYVIAGSGSLEKAKAGYAYAATSEGVLRTFAMRPGLSITGLVGHVTMAKLVVNRTEERLITERIRASHETRQQRVPVLLSFIGRGWGHGVGLCQWGARGMAAQGIAYRDILQHYYPGTQLMVLSQ